MPDESEHLIPTFVPSLIAQLLLAEQSKGSPLTEAEAVAVRDHGACIVLALADAQKMAEKRGYEDIDPYRVWEQWQVVRARFQLADDAPDL